jgi:hypothetical protein
MDPLADKYRKMWTAKKKKFLVRRSLILKVKAAHLVLLCLGNCFENETLPLIKQNLKTQTATHNKQTKNADAMVRPSRR